MLRNVGGYLVELLAVNGIDTVFGIPGVHNLELYRGLSASNIRHVLVRHEQGAGFAADGYARLSGRPAAAFVISGPGLTNIMTAVAQAYSDSVPLLVIAAAPVRESFTKQWGVLHELFDQSAVAAGVFGISRSAHSAEDVRDHLRLCLASFRTGRPRPAYLEIPLDLLSRATNLEARQFEDSAHLPRANPDHVAAAVRLLNVAARPVIIAGGGARRAAAELHHLVDVLRCPVFMTAAGKGVLPENHPSNFGTTLPFREAQALIADADVVLAVGTELGETDIYSAIRLPLGGLLIRIDVDPVKLSDHYSADVALWSDAGGALQAITDVLAPLASGHVKNPRGRADAGKAAAFRAEIDRTLDAKARAQGSALRAIKAALPWDGVVFSDMTQIAYLGNYAYPVDATGQWFHPSGYGTLGFALPAAIGAKLSNPSRAVIALAGDFGFQFTMSELLTAVEEGLSLPIVVWNNSALGQIRDDMEAAHIPQLGVIARNPDFVALSAAFGASGCRVHDAGALTQALRNALDHPGPTLIEVVASSFAEKI